MLEGIASEMQNKEDQKVLNNIIIAIRNFSNYRQKLLKQALDVIQSDTEQSSSIESGHVLS
jgi:hypothetical protein